MWSFGFTLVELLVAISILSIAILATFTAISNNLRSSNFSQDQTTAYFLADEGIEFVRNWRDTNGIANTHAYATGGNVLWLTGLAQASGDPCYGTGKFCTVDVSQNLVSTCSSDASSCPLLHRDTLSGLYGYTSSWSNTNFKRSISIVVNSATEVTVSSIITWTTNGVTKTYTLSEVLENWQ